MQRELKQRSAPFSISRTLRLRATWPTTSTLRFQDERTGGKGKGIHCGTFFCPGWISFRSKQLALRARSFILEMATLGENLRPTGQRSSQDNVCAEVGRGPLTIKSISSWATCRYPLLLGRIKTPRQHASVDIDSRNMSRSSNSGSARVERGGQVLSELVRSEKLLCSTW